MLIVYGIILGAFNLIVADYSWYLSSNRRCKVVESPKGCGKFLVVIGKLFR
jgi:hypothetical protein